MRSATSYLTLPTCAPACHPERRRREGPAVRYQKGKQVLRYARVSRASLRMTSSLALMRKNQEERNVPLPQPPPRHPITLQHKGAMGGGSRLETAHGGLLFVPKPRSPR